MKLLLILLVLINSSRLKAQELFVSTEPASNMSKGSIGLRLNSKVFKMNHDGRFETFRLGPEIMVGISKKVMLHIAGYWSDVFQNNFKLEGGSIYGKYRFYSEDGVHEHFRLACYAKVAVIKNPQVLVTHHQHLLPDGNGGVIAHDEIVFNESNDIDLDGNNSGFAGGLVATKLTNKLALSASSGYAHRLNNIGYASPAYQVKDEINYTASAGYLLFPKEYTSYKQVNCNLYVELIGLSFLKNRQYLVDIAPAIQLLFNSISRVDFSYRSQIAGNTSRLCNNSFFIRLEYNLLSIF